MDIPTRLVGKAPGVDKGGTLVRKRATLKVGAFPKDMPDHIDVDCSHLDFHKAVKVGDMKMTNLDFLDPHQASIAVVEVPRAAKMAAEDAAAAAAAAATAVPVEGAIPAAGAAPAPGAHLPRVLRVQLLLRVSLRKVTLPRRTRTLARSDQNLQNFQNLKFISKFLNILQSQNNCSRPLPIAIGIGADFVL